MALTDHRTSDNRFGTDGPRSPHHVDDPRDDRGSKAGWLLAGLALLAIVVIGFFALGGDADVDVEGGDVDIEAPSIDADVDAPSIDVDVPETDIELPTIDVEGGSIDSEGSFDVDVEEGDAEADAG